MTDAELYQAAAAIQIEQSEWGEGPDHYPAWSDEIRFTVSDRDERDRLELEHRQGCTFEAWLLITDDRRYTEVMRAVEVLREAVRAYRGVASIDWLLDRVV